jgi:hypothetical protein
VSPGPPGHFQSPPPRRHTLAAGGHAGQPCWDSRQTLAALPLQHTARCRFAIAVVRGQLLLLLLLLRLRSPSRHCVGAELWWLHWQPPCKQGRGWQWRACGLCLPGWGQQLGGPGLERHLAAAGHTASAAGRLSGPRRHAGMPGTPHRCHPAVSMDNVQ